MNRTRTADIEVPLPEVSAKDRHRAYPSYRSTETYWIPEIPEGWDFKRLRYVVTFPTKAEVRNMQPTELVSFIPMEAVGEYGGLVLDGTRPLTEVINGYTYFRDGDVLVAKITPCFENGKGAVAGGLLGGIGFGTTELHVLRAGPEILPDFLFYLTVSDDFRRLGTAEMYGAGGQKRVPEDFIKELRHPLPPLPEQRAIAAFLDRETARIDALVAKKERLIALLQEKRTALISHAVTKGLNPDVKMKDSGVEWLGEVPEHWAVVRLRRLGRVDQGCSFPHAFQGQETGEFSWFKVNDMNKGGNEVFLHHAENNVELEIVRRLQAPIFPAGTVVFPRVGAALLTNKRRILPRPAITDDNIFAFIPSAILPQYIYMVLMLVDMASLCSSGLVPTVTFSVINDLYVPLPPKSEQDTIVARIDGECKEIAALISKVDVAITLLREYRTALISAAVTGKIDVREEVPCP